MKRILFFVCAFFLSLNFAAAQDMGQFQNEYDSLDVPRVKHEEVSEVSSASEVENNEESTVKTPAENISEETTEQKSAESTEHKTETAEESETLLKNTASETETLTADEEAQKKSEKRSGIEPAKGGIAKVPSPKRPKSIDRKKADEAAEKDESKDVEKDRRNTIKYGIPSEIGDLLDELIKNEDPRFTDEIYDLFQVSKNPLIKEKVLKYFTKLEDPCLEDYAVDLLNDPYEEKAELVKASFKYISAVKTKEACPAIIAIIESENENYFADAISAIGEIGGAPEAMFLVEYLERDDLSAAQRQALMRTCGKMHAVETWDKLVEILEDEDENIYVRMYAAESIGLMQKKESVPVLVEYFKSSDPNLRQYIIKGLVNFPKVAEAMETVIQGIRDEHWKVRQESIKAAKTLELDDAMDYLIYRAKNDSEKVIKDEAYVTIAALNTGKGNDFLTDILKDKKAGDASKKKAVEVLVKEGHAGKSEITELANTCLEDDRKTSLRYAIGKELCKNKDYCSSDICLKYLSSKDSTTVSIGIDMYKNFRYGSAESKMREIAADKKGNSANKNRIKKLLDIKDEEESK